MAIILDMRDAPPSEQACSPADLNGEMSFQPCKVVEERDSVSDHCTSNLEAATSLSSSYDPHGLHIIDPAIEVHLNSTSLALRYDPNQAPQHLVLLHPPNLQSRRECSIIQYSIWVATVLSALIAMVSLVFCIRSDTLQCSSAARDFYEFYHDSSANLTSPACQTLTGKQLEAPPYASERCFVSVTRRMTGNFNRISVPNKTPQGNIRLRCRALCVGFTAISIALLASAYGRYRIYDRRPGGAIWKRLRKGESCSGIGCCTSTEVSNPNASTMV